MGASARANAGDPKALERLKEVTEAYALVKDPEKRAMYDLGVFGNDPSASGDVRAGRVRRGGRDIPLPSAAEILDFVVEGDQPERQLFDYGLLFVYCLLT